MSRQARALLALFALLALLPLVVRADTPGAFGKVIRQTVLQMDADGEITGSGGAGWTFSVVTDDTSASDGDFIAVNGGTSKDVLLPAAAEGARVRVVHVSGNGCTITTQSGDTIQLNGTTTAADPGVLTASSTNGESIELWAEDATNWVAVGGSGVWDTGE